MSDTLPHFYQRLTLSKEDARKLADETHEICGIVDGEVRVAQLSTQNQLVQGTIKPKEEDSE